MSDVPYPLCYYPVDRDEPEQRQIKLGSTVFSPAYTMLLCDEDSTGSISIRGVELYKDAGYTQVLSEDNSLESFPPSSQMEINAALDAHLHMEREDRNRQLVQLKHQQAVVNHVMDDFFARISR